MRQTVSTQQRRWRRLVKAVARLLPGSLRTVLVLQVALPVLLMLAALLAATLHVLGGFAEERLQRDVQMLARAIHLPVSAALERQDLEQLQRSLASVFGMSEVYGAYLFDAEGRRLVSFGVVRPSRAQADKALELTADGEFAQYERIRGQNVYSFFLPLFDAAGQPSGLLQVTRRRSDIDAELAELRVWAWGGFALVAVVILGGIGLAHQRVIGRPLRRVLDDMREVGADGLGHRVTESGPREVRELARGLNAMLDALQAADVRAARQRAARDEMAERLRGAETLAALGQVSAGVAHELGAPLSVVDGRARRLQRRIEDARDRSELQDIRDQTARMTSIVEQLLSFGRASIHGMRPLDVAALVRRAHALAREEGVDAHIETGPPVTLKGDALALEQALLNLLRNAAHASAGGAVVIGWKWAVTMAASLGGEGAGAGCGTRVDAGSGTDAEGDEHFDEGAGATRVRLYVDDAGEGVGEAVRARIFEPFFSTKAPGEGSGLGLAIVKRVVREHHGSITIGRSPLGGARFELEFPLEQGHEWGSDAD